MARIIRQPEPCRIVIPDFPVIGALFGLWMRRKRARRRCAWLAFASLLLMIVSYRSFGTGEAWRRTVLAYAGLSDTALIAAGILIGAALAWAGWTFPNLGAPGRAVVAA